MMLRDCLNNGVTHLARTLPPDEAKAVMQAHEKEVQRVLADILAISQDQHASVLQRARRQIALPLGHGGLGISNF